MRRTLRVHYDWFPDTPSGRAHAKNPTSELARMHKRYDEGDAYALNAFANWCRDRRNEINDRIREINAERAES